MDDSLECIFCKKKSVALKLYKFFQKDKEQNGRVCEICAKKFVPVNETEVLNLVYSEENKLSSGAFPSSLKKYLGISSENKPTVKHSNHDIVEQAVIASGIFDGLLIIYEQRDLQNPSDRKYENNVNITKAFDSVSHNTLHNEENELSSGVFPSSSKKHLDISSENKPTVKHSDHDIVEKAAIKCGITGEFLIIGEKMDSKNSNDRKYENNVNITKAFDSVSHNTVHSEENKLSSGVFPSSSKKHLDISSENKPTVKHSGYDIVEQAAIISGIFDKFLIIDEQGDSKNSSDRKHESNANIVNTFDSISHKMKKPDLCKIFPSHDFTSNKSIIRLSCHDQVEQESVTDGSLVIDDERYLKNSSDRKHESNVNIGNTFDSVSPKMEKPNVVKILPKQNLRSNKSIIRHSSHDQITQEPVTESVVTDGLLVTDEERALKNSNDRKYESNVNIINAFDSISLKIEKPNPPKLSSISNKSIRHLSHDEIRQEPVIDNEATDGLPVIDEEGYLKNSSGKKFESNINIVNVSDTISHKVQKPSMGELGPEQNSMSNKSSVRHSFQNEVKQELQIESEESDGSLIIDEDREI